MESCGAVRVRRPVETRPNAHSGAHAIEWVGVSSCASTDGSYRSSAHGETRRMSVPVSSTQPAMPPAGTWPSKGNDALSRHMNPDRLDERPSTR